MIRISEVRVPEAAEGLVYEVLRSGHLAQGPMVTRLEEGFAGLCAVTEAIAVSNGTVALELAAEALGIGPGDEVVAPAFTFVATANAMLTVGATVRLADIDPTTFTLDPESAAAAITSRTRAIVPVHLYGHPAPMTALTDLASREGLLVVEDAAQAHASSLGGQPVGSFGTGAFSFYGTKNMTTGEGGMITTGDPDLADRIRLLRNQGMRARYQYEMVGHNARLTDLQAAVGVAELAELSARTEKRRQAAAVLTAGLTGLEGVTTPFEGPGARHVFHQYTIRVGPTARLTRDDLRDALGAGGIETGVYYPRPIHRDRCFAEHPRLVAGPTPHADRAASEVLSLPVHPFLTEGDLDRIVSALRSLLG